MQGTRTSFRSKEDAIHFAEKQGANLCPVTLVFTDQLFVSLLRLGLLRVRVQHIASFRFAPDSTLLFQTIT